MVDVIDLDGDLNSGFAAVGWKSLKEVGMAGATTLAEALEPTRDDACVYLTIVPHDKAVAGTYQALEANPLVSFLTIGAGGAAPIFEEKVPMFLMKLSAHAHFPDFGVDASPPRPETPGARQERIKREKKASGKAWLELHPPASQ